MQRSILFITRKWWGTGGMQQYAHDLWRGLEQLPGTHALCRPARGLKCLVWPLAIVSALVQARRRRAIVHLGDGALCVLAPLCKHLVGCRVTATVHGLDVIYAAAWYQWLWRRCVSSVDTVVCVSRATAAAVAQRGVPTARIVVVPNGVWPQATPQPTKASQRPTMLSVGRLISRKGHAWFIGQVLPLLRREFPDLQYQIIGTGPEQSHLEQVVRDSALEQCVRLQGLVSDADRDAALIAADLLVMPNVPVAHDTEGFGLVCLEASARGTPVVAANLEGLSDAVVAGETGQLFAPGDAAACAQVITEQLQAPLLSAAVAQATQQHYAWPTLLQRYVTEVWADD